MCLNVNGMLAEKLECENGVRQCVQQYDFVFISEAWTNESSSVDIEGFKSYCKHRKRRKRAKRDSGGVVAYVKEEYVNRVHEEEWDYEDGLCFELDKAFFGLKEDIFVLCVYMKPNASSRECINVDVDCYDVLEEKLADVSDRGGVIVMGDMNARTGEKEECVIDRENDCVCESRSEVQIMQHSPVDSVISVNDLDIAGMSVERKNADRGTNEYGSRLLNVCQCADLLMLNGRAHKDRGVGRKTFFSHRGESAIDYIMCSKAVVRNVVDFEIHEPNVFSDHVVVSCTISMCCESREERVSELSERKTCTQAKWRKERKDDYVANIGTNEVKCRVNELSELISRNADTNVLERSVCELSEILVTAGSSHVKTVSREGGGRAKSRGREKVGWYDEEVGLQHMRFKEAEKRFFDEGSDESRIIMCMERNKYRKMCRQKRGDFNRLESIRLVELSKKEPNKFWKEIRPKSKNAGLPECDFYSHFKVLAERESTVDARGREEIEESLLDDVERYEEIIDEPLTMDELESNIRELKTDKSAGQDNVLNEFIVNAPVSVRLLILAIFNNILNLEYFPECWAKGGIVPIHKSGDKNVANNYRGITLLSCLGKLFTRVMNNRMTKWVDRYGKVNETQFGFRKGKGTSDCLFILHGLIELLFAKGVKLYCCFIDYQKAYDYLDRAALWSKLLKSGMSSKSIRLFKNMYSKMRLGIKGDNDRYFTSACGLLQGETTSPLFFSLFVNDIETYLSDELTGTRVRDILLKILKFADDMCIISETREGLQSGLDDLARYCSKWGTIVNIMKTKIVVFRRGGRLAQNDRWFFEGREIEVVSVFKYLGCYISSGGSFAKCIQELTYSARRSLFALKKYFVRNPEILPCLKIQLFNTIVAPILNYGSEVWGLRAAEPIEKFHRSFLKSVLRVKNSTPNCFVYGELGVYPLYIERYGRVMSFWVKIIKSRNDEKSLIYKIYSELFDLTVTNPGEVTWASRVRDVLNRCGMGNYWRAQHVDNKSEFLSIFKRRLKDIYLQEWNADVQDTSSGRLFQHIKTEFRYEPYLDKLEKSLRTAVTKFRLSSHALFIERGRWSKPRMIPRNERLCAVCGVIEDEYHCLVMCPRYENERRNRLPETLRERPCMEQLIHFFNVKNERQLRNLGILCLSVMIEHKNYV